ncbi:putative toxin-antitoxin system, toxin component [Mycobacteroides abscessus subsp. abscessus]|nr:ImmA/IrrE family metallo-endopeptidase [Brevibacterium casei]NJE67487.1 ImmA/IrrE family metallo-endopeptidase [Brevibacterium sp. LS14]QQT69269.1 ImmA/IrrE family metallo-endopeptidase [Brevibacterium casei]QZE26412.1 ImmA/IrrE family metallo-endopeptidase [Brevibacterium casei]SIK57730.1 putative toxin-antitoxin system, toxin component [Mycobacteroides abscessus subsp. abscessus]
MVIQRFVSVTRGIVSLTKALFEKPTGERGTAMAELVYQAARREAKRLLDTVWSGNYPVRMKPFNSEVGAQAYEADLGDDLSGVVSKEAGKPAKIVLNSRHVKRRNRFTWAHEIGHIVERRELADDDDYSFEELKRSTDYDLHEFFADEFAGALLMPEAKILELKESGYTLAEMAEFFDVSVDAVSKRLQRLRKHPR